MTLPQTGFDLSSEHVFSDAPAKTAVIEYGDYRCLECKKLHDVLSQVLDSSGLPVKYVFRHLPLISSEGNHLDRAIAAEAGARQGLFWEMHNALFEHAEAENTAIGQAAAEAGLDAQRFVLPVFALANAGIAISPQNISLTGSDSLGIVLGLVIGKPLGILLACWLVHRSGLARSQLS